MILTTPRLTLRPWIDQDLDAFAAMAADPAVMVDAPPIDRAATLAKMRRYQGAYADHGFTRWVMEDKAVAFLGYTGIMPIGEGHPRAPGVEIGWRLTRAAWGHGYVTEAARATLDDAFGRCGLTEVLSYTAADNARSQAVMTRLGLTREPSLDFTAAYDGADWTGLVWVASRPFPRDSAVNPG
ncbi:MAG TPA: GNAT family N-acetyltransferase [Caulobacteraceae bacterium]